ncbi:MAG TPA: HDIG domain-containing protein, partial [Patescibacteria group bacterium]|nr:HDIG domain-containing protein [Patescibacteria group bacterium]
PAPSYKLGEVASVTLKAPYDIELLDERATRERRDAEHDAVPPVFDLVVDLAGEQHEKLAALFEKGRAALQAGKARRVAGRTDPESVARVGAVLGQSLPEECLVLLIEKGFPRDFEETALRLQGSVMQGRIVASKERLPDDGSVLVREVRSGRMLEAPFAQLDEIRDIDETRAALKQQIDQELPERSGAERRAMASLVGAFVASNLTYNASETERRRANAVVSVPQVFMRIPRGRVIVREGEVFTQEAIDILGKMQGGGRMRVNWKALGGNVILLGLLVLFLNRYVQAHLKIFRRVKNLYSLVLLVTLFVTLGAWIGVFIADSVADRMARPPFNDPSSYYWALPISAGAMLVTLLANGRVATVCSAFIAMLFGMVLEWNAQATMFALVSSFAAIYGISKYERRTAILKACALVALVNMALVFALNCVQNGFRPATSGLFQLAAAASGGILAAPVVSFSLPILEWLFNVLTDIRLLELSNLDNPLLRNLSIEAPGTYNHSIIVGTLAEQAAEEIGAHALLCRVGAYYHDIGKMSKPDYFIENMRDGLNRHDKLSPRMSSLIIANHVKEGLRLAEEYNLPRQIREIIPQHHGTRLITYFYSKAKRNEDPEIPEIHESDYRYPGPKPQTKEAAIFMMADSVEAAARTVEDPTPAKFEEVITKVSNAIMLDHQLDECDLTFSDLGKIRASFLRTLAAVHHHRIDYPGFQFDRSRPRAVEAE